MSRLRPVPVVTLVVAVFAIIAVLWPRDAERGGGDAGEGVAGANPAGCLHCHSTPDHDPGGVHAEFGVACQMCHLGDASARTLAEAHAGLEREPGALDTAEQTCGRCHARELETVRMSLMATGRGIIAVNRWAFGEIPAPHGHETFADLLAESDPSPAQDHLRRLCAGCHLDTRSDNRDDAVRGIGSGCSSCHTSTRADGVHPPIDGVVPDERCLGCHSRSSRISLSYQGLAEVDGGAACAEPVTLFDGRSGCRMPPDVHQAAGMQCIDCHVHTELMGDGHAYTRQREATEVRCESCHGAAGATAPERTSAWRDVDDPITEVLARRRALTPGDDGRMALTTRGVPMYNVQEGADGWVVHAKSGERTWALTMTPDDATHRRLGHERLSCASCHSAWAPSCPTCHTHYDEAGQQWDFGLGAVAEGAWIETHDSFGVATPTLAVLPDGRIGPAAPGMIATIDAAAAGGEQRTLRLYSSFDPHTTSAQGRDCASCHRSSVALGLGTGALDVDAVPPTFAPATGALADDRWVELLSDQPGRSSYPGVTSLEPDAQERVIRVGRCLGCHGPDEPLFDDFDAAFSSMPPVCAP